MFGGFQVGPFQPLPAYQQVVISSAYRRYKRVWRSVDWSKPFYDTKEQEQEIKDVIKEIKTEKQSYLAKLEEQLELIDNKYAVEALQKEIDVVKSNIKLLQDAQDKMLEDLKIMRINRIKYREAELKKEFNEVSEIVEFMHILDYIEE